MPPKKVFLTIIRNSKLRIALYGSDVLPMNTATAAFRSSGSLKVSIWSSVSYTSLSRWNTLLLDQEASDTIFSEKKKKINKIVRYKTGRVIIEYSNYE